MNEEQLQAIEARYPEYILGRWDSEGTTGADIHALIAEVRSLRAKLDAVPVDAIKTVHWGDSTSTGFVEACGVVGDWLVSVSEQTQAVQP